MRWTGILACALLLVLCSRPPASQVGFQPITFDDWQKHLASLRGRIVVVDVWATWCTPCIERFPRMVEMHHRYKDKGVAFVSLSVDNREDQRAIAAAREFLRKQNAVFENYLLDENILQDFEKLDLLGIPAVLIYDREGRRRYKLTGDDPQRQFTHQDVEQAVATLVGIQ